MLTKTIRVYFVLFNYSTKEVSNSDNKRPINKIFGPFSKYRT